MSKAIPKGSLVLITGATGYIGSWVTYEFVKQGYCVRIASRSQEKANVLKDIIERDYGPGKVDIVIISSMSDPGAYDEAIKGVAAVNHVASVIGLHLNAEEVMRDVRNGMQNLLQLAAREASVKRFVLTSSATAMSLPVFDDGMVYSSRLWNDAAVQDMEGLDPSDPKAQTTVYAASKTIAEKMLWEFIEKERPSFVGNTVLPNFTLGPALHDVFRNTSHYMLRGVFNGDEQCIKVMTELLPQKWWVNVVDVARLHVGATALEDVKSKRLLGMAGKYDLNRFLKTMKEIDPQRRLMDEIVVQKDLSRVETGESIQVLEKMGQKGWIGYEETIRANLK